MPGASPGDPPPLGPQNPSSSAPAEPGEPPEEPATASSAPAPASTSDPAPPGQQRWPSGHRRRTGLYRGIGLHPALRGRPPTVRELQAKLWFAAFVGVPVLVALILLVAFGFVLH